MGVGVHVETGKLSNVRGDQLLAGDSVTTTRTAPTRAASTTTSTGVAGIRFDSDPSAIISLTATVDGVANPAYFFFVQSGKVNGGYTGQLTDPLRLPSSTP